MSAGSARERDLVEQFERFFRNYYREKIGQLATAYPSDQRSLIVDWHDLYRFDESLADDWIRNHATLRDCAEEALAKYDLPIDMSLEGAHVRVGNLNDADTFGVADLRSELIGTYVAVDGQVSKVSQTYARPKEAAFECQRCGTITPIPQQQAGADEIQEPHECRGCERNGPFRLNYARTDWEDRQQLRLKQPPEETMGGQGATVDVYLDDDVVAPLNSGQVKPGNHVTICGEYRVIAAGDGVDAYIDGDHVAVEESDYRNIDVSDEDLARIKTVANGDEADPYEVLKQSLAPDHYGDDDIKLALVLQMFRGVRSRKPDGSWVRGDSHILLLGDPGVGKSSLLRRIAEVAPRSTFASGKGASAAGMTAAAVPSDFGDEKWDVQAGALCLADGGIAAVDEIDKMQEDAVSSMHDALESPQVVEVDKADIHTTLPARASLLAAGNPEYGRFDEYEPLAEQIDIDPTLLSRFDLMFLLVDKPDEEEDRKKASRTLQASQEAHEYHHNADEVDEAALATAPTLSEEMIRKYVAHARRNVYPKMPNELVDQLVDTFIELRAAAYDAAESPVPVTLRKVQAMRRLAEASARVRLSDTVETDDVRRVVNLVVKSMSEVGLNEDDQFDADVIETGMSKPQRDRVKGIKKLIAQIEDAHEDEDGPGAPIGEVKKKAESQHGLDPSKVEHEIKKLKAKGVIYEPEDGHLRMT